MSLPETNPSVPPPEPPSSAVLLQRLMHTADACFDDICRQDRITETNSRAYRRARAEARLAIATKPPVSRPHAGCRIS